MRPPAVGRLSKSSVYQNSEDSHNLSHHIVPPRESHRRKDRVAFLPHRSLFVESELEGNVWIATQDDSSLSYLVHIGGGRPHTSHGLSLHRKRPSPDRTERDNPER